MKNKKNIFRFLPMDIGRIACAVLPLYYRTKRIDLKGEKVKSHIKGGAVIVAYHTGFSDPFTMGNCFWYRRLFFLTAKEVMKNRFTELLLREMGCIKIDRNASDIEAIKKCVSVLKDGKLLGIFPEGGINREGETDKIKSGAVLVAIQAGVPIIPIYIADRKNILKRQTAVIGEPFDCRDYCTKRFPSVTDIEEISEKLLIKMEGCKKAYDEYKG